MVIEVMCSCGAMIKGASEKHAKGNLKIHKISENHRETMDRKERSEAKS